MTTKQMEATEDFGPSRRAARATFRAAQLGTTTPAQDLVLACRDGILRNLDAALGR